MAEAIDHSLKHLSSEDLNAIAVYIQSTMPVSDSHVQKSADQFGAASDQLDTLRGTQLPKDFNAMTGAQNYDANCASCHQAQGQGSDDGVLPALFHNPSLGHNHSNNLVMAVLHGVHRVGVDSVMPPFAHELSDQQVTTLSNYLLTQYGNPETKVTQAQVAMLRDPATAGGSELVSLARWGMGLGAVIVLA